MVWRSRSPGRGNRTPPGPLLPWVSFSPRIDWFSRHDLLVRTWDSPGPGHGRLRRVRGRRHPGAQAERRSRGPARAELRFLPVHDDRPRVAGRQGALAVGGDGRPLGGVRAPAGHRGKDALGVVPPVRWPGEGSYAGLAATDAGHRDQHRRLGRGTEPSLSGRVHLDAEYRHRDRCSRSECAGSYVRVSSRTALRGLG